jgi:hypothetical protein
MFQSPRIPYAAFTRNHRTSLRLVASFAIAVLLALSYSGPARAMRNTSETILYFDDETHENLVGREIAPCPGGHGMWGTATDYYEQIIESCAEPPEPGSWERRCYVIYPNGVRTPVCQCLSGACPTP